MSTSQEAEEFRREMLSIHNSYRSKHHAPPMELDAALSKLAGDHAKVMMEKRHLEHTPNSPHGENIFMTMDNDTDALMKGAAREACSEWYSEINKHKFGVDPKDTSTAHFSQMVWKNSQKLGAGYALNTTIGEVYVVCNYSPPGNILGQFATNVQKA